MFKKNITKINKNNTNSGKTGARPKLVCGFTLVETLVAISILMISVTGPLYYASESLKAATYAKEQITAFYLAQDAFEQIIRIRDNNVYPTPADGIPWYSGLTGCESFCRVNPIGDFGAIDFDNDYSLYLNPNSNVYSHDDSGAPSTKTIYSRKVTIQAMDGGIKPEFNENSTEMKVTVKIEWTSRGLNRSFEAYEFLRALNT